MIQSADTKVGANAELLGTLPYISHWTGYSPSDDEMASGNYIALKVSTTDEDIAKFTVELTNGNKGELELDSDKNVVVRIADKENQKIIFRAYDSDDELLEEQVYTLDKLVLETA